MRTRLDEILHVLAPLELRLVHRRRKAARSLSLAKIPSPITGAALLATA